MRLPKLSDIEIQRELNSLAGWTRKGEALAKVFDFPSFPSGIAWVTRVAEAAEKINHHPDLDIRYTKIAAQLTTHDSGGITARDFALARTMDELAKIEMEDEPA
ncbi:MAG: 4a-hydroxytetrahydrobiopterin dehydratase [Gemmatimonadaceae bacterium]